MRRIDAQKAKIQKKFKKRKKKRNGGLRLLELWFEDENSIDMPTCHWKLQKYFSRENIVGSIVCGSIIDQ